MVSSQVTRNEMFALLEVLLTLKIANHFSVVFKQKKYKFILVKFQDKRSLREYFILQKAKQYKYLNKIINNKETLLNTTI